MPGITLGDVYNRLNLSTDINNDGKLNKADVELHAKVAKAFNDVAGANGVLDDKEVDAFISRLAPLVKAEASKQQGMKSALQAPKSGGINAKGHASIGGSLAKPGKSAVSPKTRDEVLAYVQSFNVPGFTAADASKWLYDPNTHKPVRQHSGVMKAGADGLVTWNEVLRTHKTDKPIRAPGGENVVTGPFDFHKYVNPMGSPGHDTGLACYGFKSLSDEHFEYGMKTLYLELMAQLSPFGELIKTAYEFKEGYDVAGSVGATNLMVELMEKALGGDAKLTLQEADMIARCAKSLTNPEKVALLKYARGATNTVPESIIAKLPMTILQRFESVESLEGGLSKIGKGLKVLSFGIAVYHIYENNKKGPNLALGAEEITARLMTRYYGMGGTSQGNISTYTYVKTSRHTPEEYNAIANHLYAKVKKDLEDNPDALSSKKAFYEFSQSYVLGSGHDEYALDAWLKEMQTKYNGVIVEHEETTSSEH